MQTNILGYPRIGDKRELKKANELYWSGKISLDELLEVAAKLKTKNWTLQKEAGVDLIPSNDFSFYDQVLDMSFTLGAIPERYSALAENESVNELDVYFAAARGYQKNGHDIIAMEMTKWFDTNYHYIVPEFYKNQQFKLQSQKVFSEYTEAKAQGIQTKPVLIGPISYLLLGKEKEAGFEKLDLIDNLFPVYVEILKKLRDLGAVEIELDEPFLALDLNEKEQTAFRLVYQEFHRQIPELKILLTTYFDGLKDNLPLALSLPVDILHVDLVRAPEQLDALLETISPSAQLRLSLGLIDGRNIWKNNWKNHWKVLGKP